ncbi:MAG: flavodoxin [Oscillospiraceae bacterium]|nr:flavodoxin [Oscillospiraceae bacterium]
MNAIVIYKSKYGSTKTYAEWIAKELSCRAYDAKDIKIDDLMPYDTIVYGGGLYAETIAGVTLITKNLEKLDGKKIVVYTTGITPLDCREYYDKLVLQKNFKGDSISKIKVFNFLGKMLLSELSLVHKTALKTLKKIMSDKENPTEMEKLLITLCDADADYTDKNAIDELVEYVKSE